MVNKDVCITFSDTFKYDFRILSAVAAAVAFACVVFRLMEWLNLVNPRIASGGKKKPQLKFLNHKTFQFRIRAGPSRDFSGYGLGTKCNNHVAANQCTGSCQAWRQTGMDFFWNWRHFTLMSTDMIKRIKMSIILTQVTKSKFSTTTSSKKVSQNYRDNDRQPEIAIWRTVWEAIELLSVVGRWQNHSWTLAIVDKPRYLPLEKNAFVVVKHVDALLPPSAIRVRKKTSAIQGLMDRCRMYCSSSADGCIHRHKTRIYENISAARSWTAKYYSK